MTREEAASWGDHEQRLRWRNGTRDVSNSSHTTRCEKKQRSNAASLVPMRVVEEERVESGEGLGRKVLATELTDSAEGHL